MAGEPVLHLSSEASPKALSRDWRRELNNYLQLIGQSHLLIWHHTVTGSPHQPMHVVTAICKFSKFLGAS